MECTWSWSKGMTSFSTQINKAWQSSKQTSSFLCRLIISEIIYLALVGIFHHWETFSKGFYLFVRTNSRLSQLFLRQVKKNYSNLCHNISHKSLYLVLAFATHKSSQHKMNSNFACSNLRSKGLYNKLLQSITEQLFIIFKRYLNINF